MPEQDWGQGDMGDAPFGAGITAMVGIVLTVIGAVLAVRTRDFLDRAERADGTVIDVVTNTTRNMDNEVSTSRHPLVQFTTATGTRVSFESSYSGPSVNRIGTSVPVLYDPDDPRSARIATFAALHLITLVIGGLGIAAPVWALLLFLL